METRSRVVDGLEEAALPALPTVDFSRPVSSGRQNVVERIGVEKVKRFILCLFSMAVPMRGMETNSRAVDGLDKAARPTTLTADISRPMSSGSHNVVEGMASRR